MWDLLWTKWHRPKTGATFNNGNKTSIQKKHTNTLSKENKTLIVILYKKIRKKHMQN
jgi:hypothetical protein